MLFTTAVHHQRSFAPITNGGLPHTVVTQVQFLPDCSHWVQQDQPEVVNKLLRDFLAR